MDRIEGGSEVYGKDKVSKGLKRVDLRLDKR